mgnify:CR=1 FL=1
MPLGSSRSNTLGKKFNYDVDMFGSYNTTADVSFLYKKDIATGTFIEQNTDPEQFFAEGNNLNSYLYGFDVQEDASGTQWFAYMSNLGTEIYKKISGATGKGWTYVSRLTTSGYGLCWGRNATVLSVAKSSGQRLYNYQRVGDTFTFSGTIDQIPTSTAYNVAWSPDGLKVAVGDNTIFPRVYIYDPNADTYTWISNSIAAPDGTAVNKGSRSYAVSWNKDSDIVWFADYNPPYQKTYSVVNLGNNSWQLQTWNTAAVAPPARPQGNKMPWHPTEDRIVISSSSAPYLTSYSANKQTKTLTKDGTFDIAPTAFANGQWIGTDLFVVGTYHPLNSVFVYEYNGNGGFTKLGTGSTGTTQSWGAVISSDGEIISKQIAAPYWMFHTQQNGTITTDPYSSPVPYPLTYTTVALGNGYKVYEWKPSSLYPVQWTWNGFRDIPQTWNGSTGGNGARGMTNAIMDKNSEYVFGTSSYINSSSINNISVAKIDADGNVNGLPDVIGVGYDTTYDTNTPEFAISGNGKYLAKGTTQTVSYDQQTQIDTYTRYGYLFNYTGNDTWEPATFPAGHPVNGSTYGHCFDYEGTTWFTGGGSTSDGQATGIRAYRRTGSSWADYAFIANGQYPLFATKNRTLIYKTGNTLYYANDNGSGYTEGSISMVGGSIIPNASGTKQGVLLTPDEEYVFIANGAINGQIQKWKFSNNFQTLTYIATYDINTNPQEIYFTGGYTMSANNVVWKKT